MGRGEIIRVAFCVLGSSEEFREKHIAGQGNGSSPAKSNVKRQQLDSVGKGSHAYATSYRPAGLAIKRSTNSRMK